VQAKAKVSQNKSDDEIERIISDLKDSQIPGEALLAEYMQKRRSP
jgi:predicted FMN-binding regulatory protein PaiB